MKSQRDKTNEEHKRAGKAGRVLPTALPKVPIPRENDNQEWARAFKRARYPGGNPASFDVDTHH